MGNVERSGSTSRRSHPTPPFPLSPQPELSTHRNVITAATPYPSQYQNPNSPQYLQYPSFYPPPSAAMPSFPAPYDHHHRVAHPQMDPDHGNWVGARYLSRPSFDKAIIIRNDVNLKMETLRIERDEDNPGRFLVAFTFDAAVAGSMTIMFFAKDGGDCNLSPMKESLLPPIMVNFPQGLGQKFRQAPGTGIELSMFEELELLKAGDMDVFPLAVKAEASPVIPNGSEGNPTSGLTNSQLTLAVFEKEKGEFRVRVVEQNLWVQGMRYELQSIYGDSFEGDLKECVICLSEPRDTVVLPCRHMCMCSECAKVLRFKTNRCPICRQPVEQHIEIKINDGSEE